MPCNACVKGLVAEDLFFLWFCICWIEGQERTSTVRANVAGEMLALFEQGCQSQGLMWPQWFWSSVCAELGLCLLLPDAGSLLTSEGL